MWLWHSGYMSGPVRWSNLNPLQLVQNLTRDQYIPTSAMVDLLNRAGVSSGYQHKPCLNPRDPECPATAPNKGSLQVRNYTVSCDRCNVTMTIVVD